MVDRDKVEGLIRRLREYTGYLHGLVQQDKEASLKDPRSVGSARYYLQVSIETCISIANHLIATERLRAPRDYGDSFAVLNEAGILPDEAGRTMQELAGLRNLLVHVYWDVDDEMIYEGIRAELEDFETFVAHVLTFVA
jgi:uncharacterized protein YutE (UPF0331/DUF86 family)